MKAKIKFWGVRGSIAAGKSKFGSNTSCVELDLGNQHSFFFDAGTGIREATKENRFKKISLFLSHFHWDHIQGLPFIGCLGDSNIKIEILTAFEDVDERLNHLFDPRFHPVNFDQYKEQISTKVLRTGEIYNIEGLRIQTAPLSHPGKSFAYQVSTDSASFLYATDSDYDPVVPEASQLFMNADWVICDSQFLIGDALDKANYGHSSFQHAIDTCAKHSVKNCVLYHYDPNYNDEQLQDIEKQAQLHCKNRYGEQGPSVKMAREGDSINLVF